jgi:hypothetical protein
VDQRRGRRQIFDLDVNREPLPADLADDALARGLFGWGKGQYFIFGFFHVCGFEETFSAVALGHDYTSRQAPPGWGLFLF